MKVTLNDFGIKFKKVSLLCDNESAIKLTNNPVQHARTKHIDVRHHFIRDHQQKGDICIESVGTEDQLADIFTKPLDEKRFCKLRNELNILDFSNMCWCTPHLYDMPLLRATKVKVDCKHTFFAKDLFSASSHSSHLIGLFMKIKWIWCLYGTTIASMLELI